MTRRAARTDNNQSEVVAALRAAGASVELLHTVGRGVPDLLVGYQGMNFLMEDKTVKGKLNRRQVLWHKDWRGQACIVRSGQDAVDQLTQLTPPEGGEGTGR